MNFITDIDLYILDMIQKYIKTPVLDKFMILISLLGDRGFIWILLAGIFVCTRKYRKCGFAMLMALLFSVMIGNGILKPYFERERPFVLNPDIELLINMPHDYSFPSGHTMAAFSCFFAAVFCDKTAGICIFIPASLMAFSRMYLYMHYPTDIIGGIFFGAVFGIVSAFIISKLSQRRIIDS